MNDIQKFEERYIPTTECGCWLWMGAKMQGVKGYGTFLGESAYRWSYRHHKGFIPEGIRGEL